MEKYTITLKQVVSVTVEVDAFTQEDAEEKAKETIQEVYALGEEEGMIFDTFIEDQAVEIIDTEREEY